MKVLYDPKCAELARYFLEPPVTGPRLELCEEAVEELAGVIQQAIEDWNQNRIGGTK